MLYLCNGNAMIIPVTVESGHKLCLAPGGKDPNNFFVAFVLVFNSLMKCISFRLCQSCINLTATIPK